MATFDKLESVKTLKAYYDDSLSKQHLKSLLDQANRNAVLKVEWSSIILDATHTKLDLTALKHLEKVAEETRVFEKIGAMMAGEKINNTEGRSVLHVALRKPKGDSLIVDGKDVVADVHSVLDRIEKFSSAVRSGETKGFTGKNLKNIVAIGIGGSFLGPEFVYEALR